MNKKKILALCLIVCLLAIAVVGGTLAYFTDTGDQTNTFTAGKVGITLDEAVVDYDSDGSSSRFGDLVAQGTQRTTDDQEYHLYPGMIVDKDPTITLDADSENAYVAAKVTVTNAPGKDVWNLICAIESCSCCKVVSAASKHSSNLVELDSVTSELNANLVI